MPATNPAPTLSPGEALAPRELGLGRLLEVHLPDLDLTGAAAKLVHRAMRVGVA
jgi:hypothetical protein